MLTVGPGIRLLLRPFGWIAIPIAAPGAGRLTRSESPRPFPVAAPHRVRTKLMRSASFSLFAVALAACSAHDRTTTEPPPPAPTIGFAIVSAGRDHTCALARDGSAYCWGSGVAGQLGDSARQAVLTPTAVAGGLHFAAIAAG